MRHIIFLLLIISTSTIAQQMKLISGDLTALKGQTSYNIGFSYDSMLIGQGVKEATYLRTKRQDWNAKEPGRGDDFVRFWFIDREEMYEPVFIKNFEKYSKAKLKDKNAKYKLILKTTRTEGGWSAGILNNPGEIDGELWVIESSNPTQILAKIGFYNFVGTKLYGGDFEMTERIKSAYELAGKGLGDFLKRKSRR
jgi:hypothetical protein